MNRISILVDKKTAEYLELPKNIGISIASGRNDAVRRFRRLSCDDEISVIIVSGRVLDWVEDPLSTCGERSWCPFVVSLVNKGGPRTLARRLSRLVEKTVKPA